jgi:hypothetical protein
MCTTGRAFAIRPPRAAAHCTSQTTPRTCPRSEVRRGNAPVVAFRRSGSCNTRSICTHVVETSRAFENVICIASDLSHAMMRLVTSGDALARRGTWHHVSCGQVPPPPPSLPAHLQSMASGNVVRLAYRVLAPAPALKALLLDARDMMRATRDRAVIEPVVGGRYELFDGAIQATIVAIEEVSFNKWSGGGEGSPCRSCCREQPVACCALASASGSSQCMCCALCDCRLAPCRVCVAMDTSTSRHR